MSAKIGVTFRYDQGAVLGGWQLLSLKHTIVEGLRKS